MFVFSTFCTFNVRTKTKQSSCFDNSYKVPFVFATELRLSVVTIAAPTRAFTADNIVVNASDNSSNTSAPWIQQRPIPCLHRAKPTNGNKGGRVYLIINSENGHETRADLSLSSLVNLFSRCTSYS
ncbi:unnamed protein product, partial [Nesidiocoris tenuis]